MIVEIEGMRADAVQERRARNIDPLATASDGRLRRGLENLYCSQRPLGCLVPGGTDRATQPIQKSAVRLMVDRIRPSPGRVTGDKFSERAGDWRGVVVRLDLSVTGHDVLDCKG